MWTTGEVVAPDHDRFAGGEDAFMLMCIAYLVFHNEAGASYMHDANAHLGLISANQGKLEGAGDFFDQQAIVSAIRVRLNARVMWGMRNDSLDFLVFLA